MHNYARTKKEDNKVFHFVNISTKQKASNPEYGIMELDYGWLLEIKTMTDLFNWFEMYGDVIGASIAQYMISRDFDKLINPEHHVAGLDHIESSLGYLAHIYTENQIETGKIKILDVSDKLARGATDPKMDLLLKGYTLYINHNNGWFYNHEGLEVIEHDRRDSNKLIFPEISEKDIKITKWKDGEHYYAKIGGLDVVWENEQKWNTYDEAREAALKYLKNA